MRLWHDLKGFINGDGIKKTIATVIFNPCFHSVVLFRVSNFFYRIKFVPIAKVIWYINRVFFCVDIDYRADLAGGFVLVHGLGTVIGKNVISKGPLKLYQNVTLGGGNGKPGRMDEDGEVRGMPVFYPNCIVYTGAIVVGGIKIKENTTIKAGSIVTSDIYD